jgi:hypothetical protein
MDCTLNEILNPQSPFNMTYSISTLLITSYHNFGAMSGRPQSGQVILPRASALESGESARLQCTATSFPAH